MKVVASLLALILVLPCFASAEAELTFKNVGSNNRPQAKVFLVVGGKRTAITTVLGTAFGDNLISDRSWIPAGAVSALGAVWPRGESDMYVLKKGHAYLVYARSSYGHAKKGPFKLLKTVKG